MEVSEKELKKEITFEVGTVRINQLFSQSVLELSIPDYQRPYVWTKDHIEELLSDWKDHFFKDDIYIVDAVEYYLGAIMIHEKDDQFEIIDGQQRLTTILIMDYVWNENNSLLHNSNLNFNYKSQISFQKIKENQNFLASLKASLVALKFNEIISKLVISVIITNSEDRAFVLFDSQNNRGMPLDEVDFFKSYHLRELNAFENYLKHFAKKFDNINALNQSKNHNHRNLKTLNELFVQQLWRIRFWSKNQLHFPDRRLLLETFQKKTVSFEKVDEIKLFPSSNNTLGTSLVYDEEMNPELKSRIKLFSSENIDIPFTINQPIQKGIGFFLYTEKYTSIFNYIFREEKIEELTLITKLVYEAYNDYFINLYQASMVQYFDKFQKEGIEEFAKLLEHYLGAYRMNRASIVAQSPIVLLRDYGNIMMDIQHSYLSGEVIAALKKYIPENFYSGYNYKREVINNVEHVIIQDSKNNILTNARQNYYRIVKAFYSDFISKDNYQIQEKHNWINESNIK